MTLYIVTLIPAFAPAWESNTELEINAATKAEAIKLARAQVRREMLHDARSNGALKYIAREA